MTHFDQPADDTTAMATPATPTSTLSFAAGGDTGDADAANGATMTALSDDLAFTLTAGQALEKFTAARRKVPSLRTMQRYCIEGRVAAQKIRTTYGSEWLINEDSLAKIIQGEPEITGDATAMPLPTPATPLVPTSPGAVPVTTAIDDAGVADAVELSPAMGERRRLSDVLIENAKLVAQVEGRDAIITELKEDRSFLREEVREARKTRDDVKNIAERMLDTLKTMAIGRLAMASPPPQDPFHATVVEPEPQQP